MVTSSFISGFRDSRVPDIDRSWIAHQPFLPVGRCLQMTLWIPGRMMNFRAQVKDRHACIGCFELVKPRYRCDKTCWVEQRRRRLWLRNVTLRFYRRKGLLRWIQLDKIVVEGAKTPCDSTRRGASGDPVVLLGGPDGTTGWVQWYYSTCSSLVQRLYHQKKRNKKASSTLRTSRAVTHPSTIRALWCLTSEFGRDPVFSSQYGRWRVSELCSKCRKPLKKKKKIKKT